MSHSRVLLLLVLVIHCTSSVRLLGPLSDRLSTSLKALLVPVSLDCFTILISVRLYLVVFFLFSYHPFVIVNSSRRFSHRDVFAYVAGWRLFFLNLHFLAKCWLYITIDATKITNSKENDLKASSRSSATRVI